MINKAARRKEIKSWHNGKGRTKTEAELANEALNTEIWAEVHNMPGYVYANISERDTFFRSLKSQKLAAIKERKEAAKAAKSFLEDLEGL